MSAFSRQLMVSLTCMILSVGAEAQSADVTGRFLSSIKGKCVSFPYELKSTSPKRPSSLVTGSVKLQGTCYILTFGESSLYCDGVTEWLLDNEDKELEIVQASGEDVCDINVGSIMNPASIVGHLDRYFEKKSESVVTEGGQRLVRVDFVPIHLSGGALSISSLSVWLKDVESGPVIVRSVFQGNNGSRYEFSIPSMKKSAMLPLSVFRFDEKSLGKEWEICDLR